MIKYKQLELFPEFAIPERNRLYIVGNGLDIHHGIKSRYGDFKEWVQKTCKGSNLVGLMDIFFSNYHDFWSDIEKALGEYDEEGITSFCEPDNPEDFKYDHWGQWEAGIEDSIPYIFGETMDRFRVAFNLWVRSIAIGDILTDLYLPSDAKYLSFNYTETLEEHYSIGENHILHIHGSRLEPACEFVIGHGAPRDETAPIKNEDLLLPYQNAHREVIKIMNGWKKEPGILIKKNESFFKSLKTCKGVCVFGFSYSDIDMPYLTEVVNRVSSDTKWALYYQTKDDKSKAESFAKKNGLLDYRLIHAH